MAKQRIIQTKFWSDPYIQDLEPGDKLLYLYLLTNEHTTIAGVYEITEKTIVFESGLNKNIVSKGMDTLSKKGKILYIDGWLVLKNFIKHQSLTSSKVKEGIKKCFNALPERVLDMVSYDIDTLSIGYHILEPESEPESESELPTRSEKELLYLIDVWNTKYIKKKNTPNRSIRVGDNILMNCNGITPDLLIAFKKKRKDYKKEDFVLSFNAYARERAMRNSEKDSSDYPRHRFSLYDFLKQKNGFTKFINYE